MSEPSSNSGQPSAQASGQPFGQPLEGGPLRVGVVSYLNTQPLIDGLDRLEGLALRHTVPSLLVDHLVDGDVEVALCSSIDHQRAAVPLDIVPVGMLGCRGETMTVRLYSAVPPERISVVHADTDSHTSIALLQVVLAERYGVRPRIVPFDAREGTAENRLVENPESVLLIGDKVVTTSPAAVRAPHQLDLGAAWFEMTGLPFVFAIWMARADADSKRVADIAAILDRQRRHNRERLGSIVHRRAVPRGWPEDLARRYLEECLRFDFDDEARCGLELFFAKAAALGLVETPQPVRSALAAPVQVPA